MTSHTPSRLRRRLRAPRMGPTALARLGTQTRLRGTERNAGRRTPEVGEGPRGFTAAMEVAPEASSW